MTWNSTLPPRKAPMKRGSGSLKRTPMPRTRLFLIASDGAPVVPIRPAPAARETGFPPDVKLAARTRAGNGDPEDACCEACALWLGLHGGEIQHRNARGMGGSSDPVTNSVVNAAVLCGSGALRTGCHGLCENRIPDMNGAGFWLKEGEDPREAPIMLHSPGGSGITVWLTESGGYSTEPPYGGAA